MINLNELSKQKQVKDNTVSLRISSNNLNRLTKIADSYAISRTDLFTALIESFLKEYEKEILNEERHE